MTDAEGRVLARVRDELLDARVWIEHLEKDEPPTDLEASFRLWRLAVWHRIELDLRETETKLLKGDY